MARPDKYEDIPAYSRMPVEVASFHLEECAAEPMFLTSLLLSTEVASASGKFQTEVQHGTFKILRAKTEEELDSALKAAQGTWDRSKSYYDEWRKVSTNLPPKYTWHQVRTYYRTEGLDPIPEMEQEVNA